MSGLVMSLRVTTQHPGRVFAVWVFCVAAIAFWAGVLQYLAGLPAMPTVGGAALLSIVAIPFAGSLARVVWPDQTDG